MERRQYGGGRGGGNCYAPGTGGISRYLSAPTSYFADVDFLCQPSIPETEKILERFVYAPEGSTAREMGMTMKREETGDVSMGMEYMVAGGVTDTTRIVPAKGGDVPSSLLRQRSSPAGLFDNMDIYGMGREYIAERPVSRLNGTGTVHGVTQIDDEREVHRTHPLSHHLSLSSKSSIDITAIESFLQVPDSVPFKVRAKRGCATHPRSIAERVRRTKISERMRKLQDLVPNMDKQTNTADMLDLAVDYIKELQGEVKTLSEDRDRCRCSNSSSLVWMTLLIFVQKI